MPSGPICCPLKEQVSRPSNWPTDATIDRRDVALTMTKQRWRLSDLLRGLGWALVVNIGALGLFVLLAPSGGSLAWAPALVWAMAVLAVTGFSIAEERYLVAAGFWLFQLGLFTLFLGGYMKFLTLVSAQSQ